MSDGEATASRPAHPTPPRPPPPGGPWPEGPWTQFWSWQPLARGSAHSAHSVFSSSSREGIFFPFLFPFLGHSA